MNPHSADNILWQSLCTQHVPTTNLDGDISVDLVIVGGGFTGCSAALRAAELGLDTCLLEAEFIGHGGSGRNVGLVNAGLWTPPDEVEKKLGKGPGTILNDLLAKAPDLVFNLIEKHAIKCEPLRNGTLHCAHSPGGLRDLENRFKQQRRRKAPVALLDARQTEYRTGSSLYYGALYDARAGTIQPMAYCIGLALAAQRAGARLYTHSIAKEISRQNDTWVVRTARGTVRARALLLATNGYHRQAAGVAAPHIVPAHYFQLATQPLTQTRLASILPGMEGCWDTATVMSSFRRDEAGRILIGAIGSLSHSASVIHQKWAVRKLAQLFPDLAGTPLEYAWHGRIAMTSDHLPRIVRLGPNALSIYGYSGRGIGPGTLFGACAASFLAGKGDVLPIEPVEKHMEPFSRTRMTYYEAGACLAHLVG